MSTRILNVVMYNREFVQFGGVKCAIYLTTLIHHFNEWSVSDGWMLFNADLISRITGLDVDEQREARSVLCGLGIVREGMAFDDPAMCLNLNKISELLNINN